jgi:molybdopterin-guanine dinucleotide biosynthesis protein A
VSDQATARRTDLRDVALAVLAGGAGSRMGYPKAEIRLNRRPVLHVLLERFAWPGPTLLVTAPGRERPTGHEAFTREVVDPSPGEGPLRGLLTALENSPAPWLVITAVDMPLVRREQLEWLAAGLKHRDETVVSGLMLYQAGPSGRQLQPFPSAFHVGAVPLVRRLLDSHRRALHALRDDPTIATLDAPPDWPADSWTNVNAPSDLTSYERKYPRQDSNL